MHSLNQHYQLKYIKYGSEEYNQAAQLRYRLFYQEHNIPWESIWDSEEEQDWHLVMTAKQENQVLAYGRLSQKSGDEFQIYQMVVEPKYQGRGLGKRILESLIETAIHQGASLVNLEARITKVPFYQKSGFEATGEVFASPSTGVAHIKMRKVIWR